MCQALLTLLRMQEGARRTTSTRRRRDPFSSSSVLVTTAASTGSRTRSAYPPPVQLRNGTTGGCQLGAVSGPVYARSCGPTVITMGVPDSTEFVTKVSNQPITDQVVTNLTIVRPSWSGQGRSGHSEDDGKRCVRQADRDYEDCPGRVETVTVSAKMLQSVRP